MENQNESLAVMEASALSVQRPPEVVLEEARKAASALQAVIAGKPKKVMFNGEQYLEFEDWQTVGRFYGVTAKVVSTEFADYGGVHGFTAKAVALRSDGLEVSAAEADCLNDEEKWSTRSKYEWQDVPQSEGGGRKKVKVGDEKVPLFQLKSMAQTRACAKALRNVLAWVVVLAGYKATPAEELSTTEHANESKATVTQVPTDGAATAATAAKVVCKVKQVYEVEDAKDGKKGKPGKVILTDGREGTSFDKKVIEEAQRLKKADVAVRAEFTNTTKGDRTYVNIVKVEEERQAEPSLPLEADTEPVGQPEKILTIRATKTGSNREYWEIQSDRRQYVTTNKAIRDTLEDLRVQKKTVIILFKVLKGQNASYNDITEIKDPEPGDVKDAEVVGETPAATAPAVEEPAFAQ